MRKLTGILLVLAVLMVGIVPAFAQDEEPGTIADIVVASAEAEAAEFTVLLAAVQAADPVFLEVLSSEDFSTTVFAPTDAAFAALLEALEVSAEDLLANTDLLNEVLAFHVVPGVFNAEAVVALDGAWLGTFLAGNALFVSAGDDGVTVESSNVVTTDIEASNGIVHVIDSVLVPPADDMMEEEMDDEEMGDEEMMEEMGTLADVVIASTEAEAPEFTTLLAAVQAADPSVLGILTGGAPYTVFAPTDEAFGAALEALGLTAEELLGDTETLTEILAYHVVPGTLDLASIGGLGGMMEMMEMAEEPLMLATALAGTAVEIGDGTINGANIITTDIFADNGVIHVIDGVILPPEDEM